MRSLNAEQSAKWMEKGNILLHPGYRDLDDFRKYENSNKVFDKVFFIGASPHYHDEIFNYIEEKLENEIF